MANINSTLHNQSKCRELKFTAGNGGLYKLMESASLNDGKDQLCARLSQLSSMLSMTFGEGSEAFHTNSDLNKENYLWACFMLSEECRELAKFIAIGNDDSQSVLQP